MGRRKTLCAAGLAAVMMLSAEAAADGCFVWRKGADLYEPSQKAVILHKDGIEDMILQVKYSGPAEDFCWIVPLPAAPALSAVEGDVFAELSLYTQLRWKWGYRQAEKPEVEVLSRKKVGIFDTAVLKATDPADLQRWLAKNGFAFPENRADVLKFYARKKWVFAAIRIHPDELGEDVARKLREGTIQPLLFTFKSKEIVYPLYVSSVNAGATEVLLFVLADSPVSHPWFQTDSHPRWAEQEKPEGFANLDRLGDFTEKWHDDLYYRRIMKEELPECRAALKRMGDARFFLTRLHGTFCAALMSDDVVLTPSPGLKAEFAARKPFAVRLRITAGIYRGNDVVSDFFIGEDRWFLADRRRELDSVFGVLESERGIKEVQREMEMEVKEAGAAAVDRGTRALPAWFDGLDARERAGLLHSALTLHRRAVADRAASKDPDRATIACRATDTCALAVCCKLLGKPEPEYRSWDEFQKHWPEIEAAAEK
jgi:hypothetical protein